MPVPLSSEGIHLLQHLVLWDIWVDNCKFCNAMWILFLGLPFQVQAIRHEILEYIVSSKLYLQFYALHVELLFS